MNFQPFKLGAIAKVGIFGQRVVLPAAGFVDRLRRHMPAVPLKLKNSPVRARPPVFQHEVAVEQDSLDFGQEGIVAVQVRPARLHHADLRIGEVMDRRAAGNLPAA